MKQNKKTIERFLLQHFNEMSLSIRNMKEESPPTKRNPIFIQSSK